MISKPREPFSGFSHLAGAILALLGSISLIIIGWDGPVKIFSLVVYGLSLVGLFLASACYHLAKVKPPVQLVLRKLDHSAIYLLIAGTYTPFCVNAFTGFFHWGLLAIIWIIAFAGIVVKVFYVNAPRWLNAAGYVIMGWLCVSAGGQISKLLLPEVLFWLIIGGVIYTIGAVIYTFKLFNFIPGKFGFHEVWHLFVVLGAAAHYIAVLLMISRPILKVQ